MFRQLVAIFLLLAFSAQVFNRGITLLEYYSNTAAFAKNCVNKSRPKMHCNGKCQMMKKLKEEEKKDQQSPERKGDNKNEVLPFLSNFAAFTFQAFPAISSTTSYYTTTLREKTSSDIFHPPAFV